jgi:adenylate kinase
MNISLIGPSGAGKGTHAGQLVARYNLLHLCTGDLFREHLEQQTALGILARKYMAQGEMVPDEVVDAMIEERIRKTAPMQGILFDGFPRTELQARFLDDLFRQIDRRLDAVIYLDVADDEILNRIAGREVCHECRASFRRIYHPFVECPRHTCKGEHLFRRADDTPQVARTRLRAFHRVTGPLLNYYEQTDRVAIVDGERDVIEVGAMLNGVLAEVQREKFKPSSCAELGLLLARVIRPVPPVRPPIALDLILIGAPGSGKGTQAVTLAKELQVPHIATGDLFRENLRQETELGKLAKVYMDRGELVPDDVTDSMVEERLSRADARDGFILDGYPRTLHQAEALTETLSDNHRQIAGAILLNVPDADIVARLSGRLICRKCQAPYHVQFKAPKRAGFCDVCNGPLYQRDDDKAETVIARLKTFHAQTEPVIQFYREHGCVIEVDGTEAVAEVTKHVLAAGRKVQETIAGVSSGSSSHELEHAAV